MLAVKASRGFTLLEMCFSLIIIGAIAAPLLMIYNNYTVEMKKKTTYENVYSAVDSLQQFRNVHGRYPCPGPLNLPRTDPAYGREGDCTDDAPPGPGGDTPPMTLAPGNCGSGFCVESTLRTDIALANNRVIIGALPFRALQLEEKEVSDGYGGRLVYAVTESMTNAATIDDSLGGIAVHDADGEALTDPDGSAGYIVLSHGPNQIGAYDKGGVLIETCGAGPLESENCNEGFETGISLSSGALYVSAFRSENVNQYDDTALYYSRITEPLWKRTPANLESIHDLSPEFTGVGTDDPEVALDIFSTGATDSLGVFDYSAARGRIMTDQICDPTNPAAPTNCFNPNVLGGDNDAPNNLGMLCTNPNQYMVGVGGGGALCAPIEFLCPESEPVFAGRSGGQPLCRTTPACNPMAISICGANDEGLPTAPEGFSDWYGPRGSCRYENWSCTSTGWQRTGDWGECSFTATEWDETGLNCPDPLSGTYTERRRSTCGGGYDVLSDTIAADCVCVPPTTLVDWETLSCPSGYIPGSGGPPQREWVFNPSNAVCDWQLSGNQSGGCVCDVPAVTTRWVPNGSCPSGFDPNPNGPMREQQFNAGSCSWQNTGNTTSDCTCDTTSWTYQQNHSCTNNTCETPDLNDQDEFRVDINPATCTEILPHVQTHVGSCRLKTFTWTAPVPTGQQTIPAPTDPNLIGDNCSCEEHVASTTTPAACYNQDDPNWNRFRCRCQ